jgi:peptidoglycan/xylan/chitin deacetylase (PgdA/CDA1 family)
MKRSTVLIVCLLFFWGFVSADAFASHEVTRWRDNHTAAISLTFDDGDLSQFNNAVPLLNARNLEGTFFLVTDWIPYNGVTWEQWRQVGDQGHEIGSHSVTHPYLTQLSEQEIREELSQSQEVINQNIPSQACLSFAYPYTDFNDQVKNLTSEYYFAARVGASPQGGYLNHYYTERWWSAVDFYEVAGFVVDHSVDYEQYSELHYYLYWAEQLKAWFVPTIHGVPDNKINFYNEFFDDLLTRDFWLAPFGTVVRYMRERLFSMITVLSESSAETKLNLTHSLDNSIYKEPLTIRSTVPPSWNYVKVQQGEFVSTVGSIVEGSETVIYYDAVPNSGVITLTSGPVYTLAVNVTGSGSVTKNPDKAQYNSGDVVQLTAVPASGWSFSGWSGDLTGSTNPTSITMNANKTVTATFVLAPVQYTLTVNVTGSGSVVKNPDKAQYNSGDVVQLTAVPSTGWSFSGWSGDLMGSTNPTSITMNANKTVIATFVQAPVQYTLTVNVTGSGSVVKNPDKAQYNSGDVVQLTAVPSTGWGFSGWSGDLTGSTNPTSITMSANKTVTASFTSTTNLTLLELNFEEGGGTNAYDSSGYGNNGTISGAVYTIDSAVGSYALSFNDNDTVTVEANGSLKPSSLSVALWVKHMVDTTDPNFGGIIQGAYGNGYGGGFRILDFRNKPLAQISFGDSEPIWILGNSFVQGAWCHIVLTYDHAKIRLYQNGVLVREIAETRNINWSASPSNLIIGLAQWYFTGAIDKVKMYNYALSPQEVAQLYLGGGNSAPIAQAQSVSTFEDTPVVIVLTAKDEDNDPLIYSIVNPPLNGVVTGTPPNIIYTSAAGFQGSDSFTFKANDGLADSNVATVSITVTGETTITLQDIDPGLTSPTAIYRWLDIADQPYSENYRNSFNYMQANVQVTFSSSGRAFQGTLTASNLKPNFAYQLKLAGFPGTPSNELIGLAGRWWQEEWNGATWTNGQNLNNKGDGSSPNPNDDIYLERRDITDPTSPTGLKYRYTGYLIFDYFITDEAGHAVLNFEANSSYHVLWKTSQRTRSSSDGPAKTSSFDADLSMAYDDTGGDDFSLQVVSIFGEWERLPAHGVYLQPGTYEAQIILTEESFHGSGGSFAGNWAAAVGGTIHFGIIP